MELSRVCGMFLDTTALRSKLLIETLLDKINHSLYSLNDRVNGNNGNNIIIPDL